MINAPQAAKAKEEGRGPLGRFVMRKALPLAMAFAVGMGSVLGTAVPAEARAVGVLQQKLHNANERVSSKIRSLKRDDDRSPEEVFAAERRNYTMLGPVLIKGEYYRDNSYFSDKNGVSVRRAENYYPVGDGYSTWPQSFGDPAYVVRVPAELLRSQGKWFYPGAVEIEGDVPRGVEIVALGSIKVRGDTGEFCKFKAAMPEFGPAVVPGSNWTLTKKQIGNQEYVMSYHNGSGQLQHPRAIAVGITGNVGAYSEVVTNGSQVSFGSYALDKGIKVLTGVQRSGDPDGDGIQELSEDNKKVVPTVLELKPGMPIGR